MTGKRTIVTGGAGFIGSHLADCLLAKGHSVTVLDNFSTGRPQNLAHLKGRPGFSVTRADVSDFGAIKKYFRGVDWVFHLAALADIVPSITNPEAYYRSNVTGTFSVLEAARRAGVKRFVYAASSSCYGLPDKFPTPEMSPLKPEYPYALTKYLGECCALHWAKVYKLPVISLRLFNVYGPRSRTSGGYGAVAGVFLAQKLAGMPFTVVGDGAQTRDFTYVGDVVRAFLAAAGSSLAGEVFNVGSGDTCSINRLTWLLGGKKIRIPKRPGEPDRTFADISKIKRLLRWKPEVSLERGVQILLDNIDNWRGAPLWTPEMIKRATKEWFACLAK